jgi:EmrB/QacA subfamily drug resistance transporter
VALPRLGTSLDADFGGLQWVVNSYTLTLASFILLGGALGDRYGRRRVFGFGVAWFALASALCGLAPTVELLVAGRALQGVGGALLTPGSLAIIAASFRAVDRSRAVGAWSALGGVAGAVGPFAGGWLVEWSWRAVFLVNLPVAAVVLVVAARHVPESRDTGPVPRLDVPGTLLGAGGLALLTYALIAAGDRGADPLVLLCGACAIALLAGFVVVQRRSDHPLVPPGIFASRGFTGANLVTFAAYAALGVFFFLLVLHLQVVAGFSPLVSGTALLPITVLMLLLSARIGGLADRIGASPLITAGLLLAAAGALLAGRIGPGASYSTAVLPPVVVFGLGLSLVVAPLTAAVLGTVEPGHAGVASGVNNAVARSAGLLAVALVPVAAGLSGADYTDPAAFGAAFRVAMAICAGLLAVGAALSWALLRQGGRARAPAGAPAQPPPDGADQPGVADPPALDLSRCVHCGVVGPQLHPPAVARR